MAALEAPQRPHDEPRVVAAMFGRIAKRYDLVNRLLSMGLDGSWRRFAARQTRLRPGDRALDVATGTADLAFELRKRVGSTGQVVGLDLTRQMLVLGRGKVSRRLGSHVDLHQGDAMKLPYRDGAFQATTMAFGGRNVPDLTGAFAEMARVLEPGGKAVFLELNRPGLWGFRHMFDWYFHKLSPLVGGLISGDRPAYEYLPKSVDKFEAVEDVASCMRRAGLVDIRVNRLVFGVAVVHVGTFLGSSHIRSSRLMAARGPEADNAPADEDEVFLAARKRLIRSLRAEIRDQRVLDAMARIPRQRFLDPEQASAAYDDRPLPIGHGQTTSQPLMIAIMLQEMALDGTEKVLEVGFGSGYQTAILAELASQVVAVELIPTLAKRASVVLAEFGYSNISLHLAGEDLGWSQGALYDAIVVAAAVPRVPASLVDQFGEGGRLVLPVGGPEGQDLLVVDKTAGGVTVTRKGGCGFVPLIGKEAFDDAGHQASR